MKRREFIYFVGCAAAWPLAAHAQQSAMPVIGFVRDGSAEGNTRNAAGFRKGLNETGYVDGQNVTIEYHWLEGNYDNLPALFADLVRRKVALIATPGTVPTRAAKAATSTIPIIFGVGEDPVQLGLVTSIAQPGANATGINFQTSEVAAKRLLLLHDMLPKAGRVAVLVNPRNTLIAKSTVRDLDRAGPTMGLQVQILNASTVGEIDAGATKRASARSRTIVAKARN